MDKLQERALAFKTLLDYEYKIVVLHGKLGYFAIKDIIYRYINL